MFSAHYKRAPSIFTNFLNARNVIRGHITETSYYFNKHFHTTVPCFIDDNPQHRRARPNDIYGETPPKSDNIIPQSMMSAFHNMFNFRPRVGVETVTNDGVILTNNVKLRGPVLLVNGEAFMWDVPVDTGSVLSSLKPEMFKLLEVVDPRPDILLLGTGKLLAQVPSNVREYIHNLGIQIDMMSTNNACSTFNVLSEEGRRIAAALLPAHPVSARTGTVVN